MRDQEEIRSAWKQGAERELAWWRRYLSANGLDWPDDFRARFDPDTPLQPHIADLLPSDTGPIVRILDCAAGPATTVGKVHAGCRIEVVAVDALAEPYAAMLAELGLTAPIPSIPGEIEHLDALVSAGSFDLVHMRFALDHCHDPREALRQMVRAVRPGGAVLIEHYRDETQTELAGMKRWNLRPIADDLAIENDRISFTVKEVVPHVAVEMTATPDWLTLVLRVLD